ncbi:MAG: MarR family winged helix-turn-helix transcriptional regulator [Mycobacterium sp.]
MRIAYLHRLVSRRFEQALRPLGLSVPQLEILSALILGGGPRRPSELAQRLGMERSTVSRNLALMTRHGLVETTETSPTGRSLWITVTVGGRSALAKAEQAWQSAQTDVQKAIGPEAAGTMDDWLVSLTGRGF